MNQIYKQFTNLSTAQAYASAQTTLAGLPNGATFSWSQPIKLSDGSYVVQAFSDSTATPWISAWQLPPLSIPI